MSPLDLRVAVLVVAAMGCDDLVVNAFVGQLYDPTGQCLKPKSVIDVIEGEAHGTCEGVRCFVDTAGDAFISTRCEAPPGFEDRTLDVRDRQCKLALEVYELATRKRIASVRDGRSYRHGEVAFVSDDNIRRAIASLSSSSTCRRSSLIS